MKTVQLKHDSQPIRDIARAAAVEPVTLVDDEMPIAVVVSIDEFARLDEARCIRREAGERLKATMAEAGRQATERGLTDEALERLLADDS